MTKAELLSLAKKRFKLACESESEQRRREREDLEFQIGELQWDADAKATRMGATVGNQVIPARPMLSVDLIRQPKQLVLNQAVEAHLGVEVHPVSEDADKDIAEVKQDLYRRIERDSNAAQGRMWGFDRASQCGRGWYRIGTKYDEDSENPDDQEITIDRILYQDMVYADPAAQKPDFSDGRFIFVAAWMPITEFKDKYPDAQTSTAGFDFRAFSISDPDWVKGDGDDQAVLVAEYWYKEYERKKVERKGRNHWTEKVTVKCAHVTGVEVLEEYDWAGKYLPFVPVIGQELQPFDGSRRWEGMVRPARDGQKFANFAASNLVERMSLEPKAPWVMAEGQAEDHEQEWQQANIRNFAYIEYKPTTIEGKPAPPPQRTPIDSSGMSLSLMAWQEAKGFVQSATSVYAPSLGEVPQRKDAQSGRAILALQNQSDAGTGQYLQNLANISMTYEAKVVLDLMPYIYDRPGRITQVLGGEDEARMVMLNAPSMPGPDGKPIPAQEGDPKAKTYDLSKGRYAVSVSIGKSFQTRLQQGQQVLGEMLPNLPPEFQVLALPTFMRFQDTPGAKELGDLLAKYRDSKFPGLVEGKDGMPSPEQLQGQIQAMQQKGQEMSQQLQMAIQEIKTDQAKQQATLEKAKIDAQKELELQRMKDATAIAVAQINAQAKVGMAATEDENEALATGLQHAHEAEQAELDRGHEAAMSVQGSMPPEGEMPEAPLTNAGEGSV